VKQKENLNPFLSQNQQNNKIFLLNGKNRLLFFVRSRKRSKRKSCISHRHTIFGSAFSLIIKGKEEAWQKETSCGHLFEVKSQQKPTKQYNT